MYCGIIKQPLVLVLCFMISNKDFHYGIGVVCLFIQMLAVYYQIIRLSLVNFSILFMLFIILTGLCEVCSFKLNYHHKRKEVTRKPSKTKTDKKKKKKKEKKRKKHKKRRSGEKSRNKRQEHEPSSSSSDSDEDEGQEKGKSIGYQQ